MSEYIKTLEYYFKDGSHVVFEKYTINALDAIIQCKKLGKSPSIHINAGGYNVCSVTNNDRKRYGILVARAVASTFLGKPPTPEYTADHIESIQKNNDALSNIRWNSKLGQRDNQIRPETSKTAFVIVNNGVEKTVNDWVKHMNANKTLEEREFTKNMISMYAIKKQRGFAYKEYPDLEGEEWKEIKDSKNTQGCWEISNKNRVKYITKHTENVLWGERLGRLNGYPIVGINGKKWLCHILAFKTFHPELWAAKKPDEMVLHEDDDKEDFRPHKLYLGTASVNRKDAHDNGKYDGTKTARTKCASYINGKHEENHDSQKAAVEYLKTKGYPKASKGNISMTLSGDLKSAYGRTWQKIE
ncbi:hypothetical protein FR483_N706R [Paramecium bursaria Chlorella virus FR483]|uniref:Uncharacterized protein N706R n=1 Tax=Paramecium bursaria Chlorella virus FR483 TaxID=399781 RepID=A7J860_PBCVF|nr:hypothetical protein FR483_N706R [Paramecium bursaria Chlorella virus FR483]ABT15991.1 hypothetical protein FR483_N706R [Paramecium bursaria Chlorella virus FR483]